MIGDLLGGFWPYIAGIVVMIGTALGLYGKGRADAMAKAKLQSAEATILAENLRKETDDDIQQDTDLVGRAKRIGLVRPDGT